MIAIYGNHNLGQRADETFHDMCSSGIVPNEITFVNLLNALAHSGMNINNTFILRYWLTLY